MADTQALKPQLCMCLESLENLDAIVLPEGYSVRTSRESDGIHWARIIRESFADESVDDSRFVQEMKNHPAYRPDRIFFVCAPDGLPCATASAYRNERFGADTGYIHYVGVCPGHAGKRLGMLATLAALRKFREEGLDRAVLETDDFRLAALKTYLRLGFTPLIVDENQPTRWDIVYTKLGIGQFRNQ